MKYIFILYISLSIRSWKIRDLTFSSLYNECFWFGYFSLFFFIYCFYSSTSFIWSILSATIFPLSWNRLRFFFALSSRFESYAFDLLVHFVSYRWTGWFIHPRYFSFLVCQTAKRSASLEIDFAAEVKNFSISANLFLLVDKLRLNLGYLLEERNVFYIFQLLFV